VTRRERFFTHVDVRGEDECWEWHGSRLPSGYGHCWTGTGFTTAHRFAYLLTHEVDLERTDEIHHTCRNRACVNPAHLVLESRDEHRRNHHRKERCPKGHLYTDENTTWISWGKKRPVRRCRTCARERMQERRDQAKAAKAM